MDLKDNYYINNYLFKPFSKKVFIENINDYFRNNNKDIIIEKIKSELEKIHFKYAYKGTKYLIMCIYEIYFLEDKLNYNIIKDIIPIVAQKYNKTVDCVYRNIKNAITNMYCDCSEEDLKKYFNCYIGEKPKIEDVVNRIIYNIINQ